MKSFLLSVVASTLGGAILIITTGVISQKARWVLMGLFSRMLDVDIDYVYKDKRHSESSVMDEIKKAAWVKIFIGRGNELQRPSLNGVLKRSQTGESPSVKILLPEVSVGVGHYDWLDLRDSEIATFDPSFGSGLLKRQVESNYGFLSKYVEEGRVELRKYNLPNFARIIITDRSLIFTPYKKNVSSSQCKVYVFRKNTDLYDNMDNLFDVVWQAALSAGHAAS